MWGACGCEELLRRAEHALAVACALSDVLCEERVLVSDVVLRAGVAAATRAAEVRVRPCCVLSSQRG